MSLKHCYNFEDFRRLAKKKLNLCKFHGVCKVDDGVVADAIFSANLVDRALE